MTDTSSIYGAMQRPSMVDYPGRMAAVLFTTGCNFRCGFCHNAALLGTPQRGYTWEQLGAMCDRYRRNWVTAVVITGGEPTLAPGVKDTVCFFRDRGFEVKLDSNGSRPDTLAELLPFVDYVAMDIKCHLDQYGEFVGFADTSAITRSVGLIKAGSTPHEFRTTVIEGVHRPDDFHALGALVGGAPSFALQAFIPRDDLPDPALTAKPRTRPAFLEECAVVLRNYVQRVDIRGA